MVSHTRMKVSLGRRFPLVAEVIATCTSIARKSRPRLRIYRYVCSRRGTSRRVVSPLHIAHSRKIRSVDSSRWCLPPSAFPSMAALIINKRSLFFTAALLARGVTARETCRMIEREIRFHYRDFRFCCANKIREKRKKENRKRKGGKREPLPGKNSSQRKPRSSWPVLSLLLFNRTFDRLKFEITCTNWFVNRFVLNNVAECCGMLEPVFPTSLSI